MRGRGFVGVSTRHGYGDLVRAVFEGLAFAARDCYAAMGPLPGEVRLTGGAARSPALRKILGAALGADVRTSEREEAGAAGAAMIAAVSIGQYGSMDECAAEWVTPLLGDGRAARPQTRRDLRPGLPGLSHRRMRRLRPVWRSLAAARDS